MTQTCLVQVMVDVEHEYPKTKVRKLTRTIHYKKSTMLSHVWVQRTDVNIKMKSFSVFNQDFSEEVENDVEVGGFFVVLASRSRFHQ